MAGRLLFVALYSKKKPEVTPGDLTILTILTKTY